MEKNMSISDRKIRWILASILIVLFLTNVVHGVAGIISLILAGVFVLTGFVRFCPLYSLFKTNTLKTKKTQDVTTRN